MDSKMMFSFLIGLLFLVPAQSAPSQPNHPAKTSGDEEILVDAIADALDDLERRKNLKIYAESSRESVCYEHLGCFNLTGPMGHTLELPDSPEAIDVQYYAFTPDNPDKEYQLNLNQPNTLDVIDTEKRLAIIIHGYRNIYTCDVLVDIKNSMLKHVSDDVGTVILVDWSKGCNGLYTKAASNSEVAGDEIAMFTDQLIKQIAVDPKKVYLLGFSLGAQVAGFAGKFSQKQFGWKYGRITGLDAAAPLFEGHPGSFLTEKDADYVDGIHTNIGNNIFLNELGFTEPYAHIDFYPNGGNHQPWCHIDSGITCNHRAAPILYEASLSAKCQFKGHLCNNYQDYQNGLCKPTDSVMGYQADQTAKVTGKHYLQTSDKYPFCDKN